MIILIKIAQLVIALSTLIFIHELGHFTFARLFKIKVDKFFLFFDVNGFCLLSTKKGWFSKLFPSLKNKETEYGIGWLPLGGYCKINGMIDESLDIKNLKEEPKAWEFRTKPAWQRLLTMAGGVLYNFIFAIVIYICIMAIFGESYISNKDSKIYVNEVGKEIGFKTGDQILKFDDFTPENFGMLQADLVRRTAHKIVVLRGNDTVNIYMDKRMVGKVINSPYMFEPAIPFIIDSIPSNSVNFTSEFKKGDILTSLNGEKIEYVQDSRSILEKFAGTKALATILRGNDTLKKEVQIDSTGRIGIYLKMPPIITKRYNWFTAIPAGMRYTFQTIGGYLRDLKLVVTPKTQAYKSVGSFISIGQIFPAKWDWLTFINLLALLSIMLGVMNLIPIPGLDGGHIIFILYEIVSGRKPSDNFLITTQIIGMIFLFILMIFAFGNDIFRFLL